MRNRLKLLLLFVLGGISASIVVELVLTVLPVNNNFGQAVSPRFAPFAAGEPNRSFIYCRDWNFALLNRGKNNSDGFHADFEYPIDGKRDVTVVVGDSFIEAVMVPIKNTLQGELGKIHSAEGLGEVVGLGVSSAALGSYEYLVEKANSLWGVNAAVIAINNQDITKSMEPSPGCFHYEVVDGEMDLAFTPIETEGLPPLKRWVFDLSTVRYITRQLRLWPAQLRKRFRKNELTRPWMPAVTMPSGSSPGEIDRVIDQLVTRLAQIQTESDCQMVLLLNGVYSDPFSLAPQRVPELPTALLMEKARESGLEVVDVYQVLHKLAKDEQLRGRWMKDSHWTPEAHIALARHVAGVLKRGREGADR